MTKIFTCCNWQLKFLGPIVDYWKAQGHEVIYKLGYDPELHEWSDVCFIDVCDNNAIVGSKQKFPNSRLVIRAIDIECWVGQPGPVTWENVDALIFGAKHIEELVRSYLPPLPESLQVVHVPFGLDLGKWTFRERDGTRRNVACVCHRWSAKGLPLLLQVMAKLPGYRLHLLGTPSTEKWLHAYVDHIVAEMGLDVTITTGVPSVDEWLEDKEYLILGSQKESFSYACAEAAAKGIRPLIHNFWRARDIWPHGWVWNTIDECVTEVLHGSYDSAVYRSFIAENYSLERMMEGINKVCGVD